MKMSSIVNIFHVTSFCDGNPMVTGGFPPQKQVAQSCDVLFDLRPNKRLSKHSSRWLIGMI